MTLKQGDIILVDYRKTHKNVGKVRPSIVISNNGIAKASDSVTVIPLTRNRGNVKRDDFVLYGNPYVDNSKAPCSTLNNIKKAQVNKVLGKVNDWELKQIKKRIIHALGLEV